MGWNESWSSPKFQYENTHGKGYRYTQTDPGLFPDWDCIIHILWGIHPHLYNFYFGRTFLETSPSDLPRWSNTSLHLNPSTHSLSSGYDKEWYRWLTSYGFVLFVLQNLYFTLRLTLHSYDWSVESWYIPTYKFSIFLLSISMDLFVPVNTFRIFLDLLNIISFILLLLIELLWFLIKRHNSSLILAIVNQPFKSLKGISSSLVMSPRRYAIVLSALSKLQNSIVNLNNDDNTQNSSFLQEA